MPDFLVKLIRRLMGLHEGRYQIILTIGKDFWDWTVTDLGKIERVEK